MIVVGTEVVGREVNVVGTEVVGREHCKEGWERDER